MFPEILIKEIKKKALEETSLRNATVQNKSMERHEESWLF